MEPSTGTATHVVSTAVSSTFYLQSPKGQLIISSTKNMSFNRWELQSREKVEEMDICALLTIEYGALGLMMKKSTIQNPSAGYGVFAARNIGKGDIIGGYYRKLIYDRQENNMKSISYGEVNMRVE